MYKNWVLQNEIEKKRGKAKDLDILK